MSVIRYSRNEQYKTRFIGGEKVKTRRFIVQSSVLLRRMENNLEIDSLGSELKETTKYVILSMILELKTNV